MKNNVKKLVLSAMFIAIGLVLPFLTGQIREIGSMLLPMHLPVLLCGLICGWQYGLAVGFIVPLLRSFLFSMPMLYPTAIAMAFELATYGLVTGLIYSRVKKQNIGTLYMSLISAMLAGRIIFGIAQVILLGLKNQAYSWPAFIGASFTNALPGIIIQLILIPAIMTASHKSKLLPQKQ